MQKEGHVLRARFRPSARSRWETRQIDSRKFYTRCSVIEQPGHLPEHFSAQWQDEREAIVTFHTSDGNADEISV